MSKSKINSWKDCRSDRKIIQVARENGLEYRECAGDHFQIKDPRSGSAMTAYHSENISTGVAVKIFKWLRNIGIAALIIGYFLTRNVCNQNNYTSVASYPDGSIVYICE